MIEFITILVISIIVLVSIGTTQLIFYIFDNKNNINEIMEEEKYIKLSYKRAVLLEKIGIEIFDNFGSFYFNKPICNIYETERIYILFSHIDLLRFKSYKKKQEKNKEKNKMYKNESKEAYEYLLRELNKYANDCQINADECFAESKSIISEYVKGE